MVSSRSLITSLLISALLLSIFLPPGFGRRIKVVRRFDAGYSYEASLEEKSWVGRAMAEMEMDYKEPGANTNPRGGALYNSPPSPPRA